MSEWRNWAGDQVCQPVARHSASSAGELADIVGTAAIDGHQVRVRGSGHSFSPAVLTDGVLVDVDGMNRILDVDVASGLVRVEAGITLRDLNEQLDTLGLALPNLGDIDRQTIAGAIATGTHGTGATLPNISAQLEALDLIAADGTTTTIDGGDDLLAARVNLGALGAVATVTLRTVPAFVLHRTDETMPLDRVLEGFDEHADANDHFEFFVFPYATTALTIRRNRTDAEPAPRGRLHQLVNEELIGNRVADLLLRLTRARPSLIPRFSALASRVMDEGDYIDKSFRVFASPREIRFTEMEYAVPRAKGPEAVRAVVDLIEREQIAVAMPVECRVVAGDDAFLSPAHGRDSVYIAVHQYRGMDHEAYFQAAEEILRDLGGRPHWGKRHTLDAVTTAELYPRLADFLAVRDRLDPDRVFGNDWTRTVLG
ncbi:MAG: D-arabinono-1,4-lactone oxidase [Nitriliruptorales bacterium]|nr:D-arabinono-1,4-lactone oxidase [Nitriliruptorales bacterium]